jgi:hypothetical protein
MRRIVMRGQKQDRVTSGIDLWVTVAPYALALLMVFLAAQLHAQTFTVLHTFTGAADGVNPYAGLSMDRAGSLYGTAAFDGNEGGSCRGTSGCGTVYKLARKNSGWLFYTLYQFSGPDGQNPESRVIIGPDGNLYGTTNVGGSAHAVSSQ